MKNDDTFYFYIHGIGCHRFVKAEEQHAKVAKTKNVKILCNPSFYKSMYTVFKQFIGVHPDVHTDKYIQEVFMEIIAKSKVFKKVIVAGHSYGGGVVSAVAEACNKIPLVAENIYFYTFGSIYIPKTKNVHITHFLQKNDIAIRCNRICQETTLNTNIVWVPSTISKEEKGKYITEYIMGSSHEWASHLDYILFIGDF